MEKFALLNLIKALGGISQQEGENNLQKPDLSSDNIPNSPAPPKANETPNVMASVIERHERISNRVHTTARRQ